MLQRIAEGGRIEHLFVLGRPLPKPEDIRLAAAASRIETLRRAVETSHRGPGPGG